MISNEAAAQGFCCIQKLPPQSSREFRVPGQEGAIWEGSQTARRPPFITKGNTGEEGLCLRGEKESAFPTPHTNNKSHLACKYLTRCSEWWTGANETADNTTWSERARAKERGVKRLGNQIRMIKRNWRILRMQLTNLWKTLRGDIFLDNQITACLFLSLLFGRRFRLLHVNLLRKEEVANWQEEKGDLEMSPSQGWRKTIVMLPSPVLAPATSVTSTLPLMFTGRGEDKEQARLREANLLYPRREWGHW